MVFEQKKKKKENEPTFEKTGMREAQRLKMMQVNQGGDRNEPERTRDG